MTDTPQRHYDADLQMFVETPHAVDHNHLAYLRWLVETGHMGHAAAGPSSGDLVVPAPQEKVAP